METEVHPFPPFIPEKAKVLIMGTFPPGPHRWSMEFYYPNRSNDFWKVMGLIFFDNPDIFFDKEAGKFRLNEIKKFLNDKGIALHDTGHVIRRLKNNASDKFLEIIEPVDLEALLKRMPDLKAIATTGEKAADVLAKLTNSNAPKMGSHIIIENPILESNNKEISIWRMPSTSRAYPLALSKKADFYRVLFNSVGLKQ